MLNIKHLNLHFLNQCKYYDNINVSTMTTIRKCSAPMIIIGIIGLLED